MDADRSQIMVRSGIRWTTYNPACHGVSFTFVMVVWRGDVNTRLCSLAGRRYLRSRKFPAETWFKKCACFPVQRPPRRAQHLVDQRRCCCRGGRRNLLALQDCFLLLAFITLAALSLLPACTSTLQDPTGRGCILSLAGAFSGAAGVSSGWSAGGA